MFSLFFVIITIVTNTYTSFEGVYFLMGIVDIAFVFGVCCIAAELANKSKGK